MVPLTLGLVTEEAPCLGNDFLRDVFVQELSCSGSLAPPKRSGVPRVPPTLRAIEAEYAVEFDGLALASNVDIRFFGLGIVYPHSGPVVPELLDGLAVKKHVTVRGHHTDFRVGYGLSIGSKNGACEQSSGEGGGDWFHGFT